MGKQAKKNCSKCTKDKGLKTEFYTSFHPLDSDGRLRICKKCVQDMIDPNDIKTLKDTLRMLDKPYVAHLWEVAATKNASIGEYFKYINAKDFRYLTWADSTHESQNKQHEQEKDKESNINTSSSPNGFTVTDELINKWGEGYTNEEYRSFERKYNMLKNNYQEKTAMHTEALLTYIRYRVKEELATSKGDSKAAKDWGAMAKDAATAAKINPSQLSKSDLTDGLDTFGQLVRTVEQAVDIIPILPQFKERPHDKVDFAMLCYINYIRDLKGLPLAEYKDVYEFYEERKKEYENRFDFLNEDGDE